MFRLVLLCGLLLAICTAPLAIASRGPGGTEWGVRTSVGFDALCALNLLSDDPYYLSQYPNDTRVLAQPRYAAARDAARRLRAVIKDQGGGIVSAFLTLVFSGGPDSTIAALLDGARHPEGLQRSLRASPFWSEKTWQTFERVRPDVVAALEGMESAGFESDWRERLGAGMAARAAALEDSLERYDVLGEQGRLIGHPPAGGGGIEVILLYYSRPHGIRIQGERFLTNVGYPLSVILRNAAHEPLHPPFDAQQPGVRAVLGDLARDSLIRRIVATHDPAFGYNTVDGYVEEDAVQALEQIVSERLGFAVPAAERWRVADGGMHLLGAALYDLMKESGFDARGGRFAAWLLKEHAHGALRPAEIDRRVRRVLGDAAVDRWRGTPPAR